MNSTKPGGLRRQGGPSPKFFITSSCFIFFTADYVFFCFTTESVRMTILKIGTNVVGVPLTDNYVSFLGRKMLRVGINDIYMTFPDVERFFCL